MKFLQRLCTLKACAVSSNRAARGALISKVDLYVYTSTVCVEIFMNILVCGWLQFSHIKHKYINTHKVYHMVCM